MSADGVLRSGGCAHYNTILPHDAPHALSQEPLTRAPDDQVQLSLKELEEEVTR